MEFTSVVNNLGSLPLLILIIVIFILLLKEVKKDNERTRSALQQYKAHSDEALKEAFQSECCTSEDGGEDPDNRAGLCGQGICAGDKQQLENGDQAA